MEIPGVSSPRPTRGDSLYMTRRNFSEGQTSSQLPISSNQDVEFSDEVADEEDREAQERAEAAARRVEGYEGG